jgi:osmotically-inducible protein OsmY
MVIVYTTTTTDHAAAWRVRDALAAHPLLAGATAYIRVSAGSQGILLEGWVLNERSARLALHLACRAAGQRSVRPNLQTQAANTKLAQRIFDDNTTHAPS